MSEDPIKDALRMMPYGFYSITSKADDDQKTCYTHGLIEKGGVFALNIFRKEDQELIKPFTKGRAKNPDKMKQASFTPAPETGCPVLEGSAAYLECRLVRIIDIGGDHDIVVGEIVGAGVTKSGEVSETLTLPHLGWSYAG
jgi:flavin reductase (DIM6/NTAB) family NADH-FMN oxidoreductase RutF